MQHNKVFAEHAGSDLGVVFEPAGGTIQKFLFIVDDAQTLFADGVTAAEVSRGFLLGVVKVVAHRALHFLLFIIRNTSLLNQVKLKLTGNIIIEYNNTIGKK